MAFPPYPCKIGKKDVFLFPNSSHSSLVLWVWVELSFSLWMNRFLSLEMEIFRKYIGLVCPHIWLFQWYY